MKNSVFGLVTFAVSLGSPAFAGRILPLPFPQLERVLVKKVVLEGDFMPPLPPGSSGKPMTTLTVQVDSNGCTKSEDFRIQVSPTAQGQKLAIIRIRPDTCRAFFPEGTEVELMTGAAGFGSLLVANPLRVEDRTTH